MSDQAELKRQEGKLIIGLTGNIATGKSAVMRLAADQGALTIDADKLVHGGVWVGNKKRKRPY